MRFKDLKEDDYDIIRKVYQTSNSKLEAQTELSERYDVSERTIRKWANLLNIGVMAKNVVNPSKIMIYDIETSRVQALLWWSGKQFVNGNQLMEDPKIISIAWKWLGEDKVYALTWDKNHSDEEMLRKFLSEYNKADMVIGQNNDRFDNRWVNARAAKYDLEVNTLVRSFDIMKENKNKFRLPSYSMKYMCEYFGVEQKLEHSGIKMWDKIQFGTPEEQEEYLKEMVDYNKGDIVSTEALYMRLRKYYGHKVHFGVLHGDERFTCPNCGSKNVNLHKTTVTPAGTVQRIMKCNDDDVTYRVSNKVYMDFINHKIKNNY